MGEIMKGYKVKIYKDTPLLTEVKELTYTVEENIWDNFEDYTIQVNAEDEAEAIYFSSQILKEYLDKWYKNTNKALGELWRKKRYGIN